MMEALADGGILEGAGLGLEGAPQLGVGPRLVVVEIPERILHGAVPLCGATEVS